MSERIALLLPNSRFSSEASFLDYAQNLAHSALMVHRPVNIHKQVLDLAHLQIITK